MGYIRHLIKANFSYIMANSDILKYVIKINIMIMPYIYRYHSTLWLYIGARYEEGSSYLFISYGFNMYTFSNYKEQRVV